MHPDNFPFIESCSQASASDAGVVKITNLPYTTTHQEIKALLGRNAKLLTEESVHVIMERINGKTQDAYVEFCSQDDAIRAVQRLSQAAVRTNRPSRIADRPVDVELSGQASMTSAAANPCVRRAGPRQASSRSARGLGFRIGASFRRRSGPGPVARGRIAALIMAGGPLIPSLW